MFTPRFMRHAGRWVAFAVIGMLTAASAQSHGDGEPRTRAALSPTPIDTAAASGAAALSPIHARYRVTYTDRSKPSRPTRKQQEWQFFRDTDSVALVKGNIEDVWHRAPDGSVSLERVFHDDRRVIDYSAGELRTLGVTPAWAVLCTFVDPGEFVAMKALGGAGSGNASRIRYAATAPDQPREISWAPALGLPALLTRRVDRHAELRFELVAWQAGAPAHSSRALDYLRIDAADFGDMEYDPIVRKAELLDVRAGWRAAHRHE